MILTVCFCLDDSPSFVEAAFAPIRQSRATTTRSSSTTRIHLLTKEKEKVASPPDTTAKKKKVSSSDAMVVNGEKKHTTTTSSIDHQQDTQQQQHAGGSSSTGGDVFNLTALGLSDTGLQVNVTDLVEEFGKNVTELVEDMNRQMTDGTKEMLGNMTEILEEKLAQQPASTSSSSTTDVLTYISELNEEIARAQKREMERQMMEFEKAFIRPLEDFAFSDAKLSMLPDSTKGGTTGSSAVDIVDEEARRREIEEHRRELVLTGENSTVFETSRRLKTSEILRNLNVAPLYYSITLCLRWLNKVKSPPMAALRFFKGLSALFGSPSKIRGKKKLQSYDEFMKDAGQMQAGWKRTGEIAAKGPVARKWAIMRRSAEIWGYFASFYLKEKRMEKKSNSGKWSAEKFSEERSKLGAEVTQNLLKLGPTFIKVRLDCTCILTTLPFVHTCNFLFDRFAHN